MKFLEGKKALVLGIASNRSIAWGISDSLKKMEPSLLLRIKMKN